MLLLLLHILHHVVSPCAEYCVYYLFNLMRVLFYFNFQACEAVSVLYL